MSIDASLRPLRADDRERLLAWRNLPEVARWMYTDHVISPEEHARWFEAVLGAQDRRYWIIEHEGRPVGLTNLVHLSPADGTAELGYYLADPEARGLGLGLFAEFSVVDQAFGDLCLRELFSEVIDGNEPSRKLLERLGFHLVGTLKEQVVKSGRSLDVHRYRLSQEDWREGRELSRRMLRGRGYAV